MKAEITAGQVSDYRGYDAVMDDDAPPPKVLIADKGYDSDAIREDVKARGDRRSARWRRGSSDRGFRDLRHQKQTGPYRTQPEDRRGGFDSGVDISDIQGREDAEGCRERGFRVMTLERHPTAVGQDSGHLHVEFSRFLCFQPQPNTCASTAIRGLGPS